MGELAALGAALCWSLASLLFERFGRSAGGLALNTIKCALALVLFAPSLYIATGVVWPAELSLRTTGILGVSGLIGLSIGDTLWFGALLRLGARRALLLVTVTPLMTALLGAAVLGEPVTAGMTAGMAVTLAGIAWVILERTPPLVPAVGPQGEHAVDEKGAVPLSKLPPTDWIGVALALGSGACQATGSVLTKYGGIERSALEVSVVRLTIGAVGLAVVVTLMRRWPRVRAPFSTRRSGWAVIAATFLGTYLGVWLMNAGLLYAPVGVAATLNATSPLFVLPFAALFFGERLTARSVAGAFIAVAGVALLFLLA